MNLRNFDKKAIEDGSIVHSFYIFWIFEHVHKYFHVNGKHPEIFLGKLIHLSCKINCDWIWKQWYLWIYLGLFIHQCLGNERNFEKCVWYAHLSEIIAFSMPIIFFFSLKPIFCRLIESDDWFGRLELNWEMQFSIWVKCFDCKISVFHLISQGSIAAS